MKFTSKVYFLLFFIAGFALIIYLYNNGALEQHELVTMRNGSGSPPVVLFGRSSATEEAGKSFFESQPAGPIYSWRNMLTAQGNGEGDSWDTGVTNATYEGINPDDIPQGFALAQLSPYFQKIRLGGVWGVGGTYGQITIVSWLPAGESVSISGWTLQSNTRNRMAIPKGIGTYSPYISNLGGIIFRGGDTLNIYSSTSSLGRAAIRLNKCMGYLQNASEFNPGFSWSCPDDINRTGIRTLAGRCQDYILSLGSCAEPDLNHPDVRSDISCRAYLEGLNYAGCFARHAGDADFATNEWRAWVGDQFLAMDERHDRILLFDDRGLLVDEYLY